GFLSSLSSALGNLRYHLRDVPPQPNNPPNLSSSGSRATRSSALGLERDPYGCLFPLNRGLAAESSSARFTPKTPHSPTLASGGFGAGLLPVHSPF
ncbi:hypothetical protein JTE90_028300, partial [Oedothorax gibbosus]